jgi:GT2 family glycosyltransferase
VTASVTVIVPTRDRPAQLAGCLEALARQDYPRYDVLVVDDASAAPVAAEVEVLRLPASAGPAAARNAGAGRARGEVLAFTDDDCRPEPGWLAALAAALDGPEPLLVGGRMVGRAGDGDCRLASQLVLDLVYAHYNEDPGRARFLASSNLAVRADDFHAAGGFDARFRISEDRELCDRWRHRGRRIVYAPDAVVVHAPDLSLPAFCRQHFRYGRGAFAFHRERVRRGSGRLLGELAFYPHLARQLPGRVAGLEARRARAAGLLAVWQVANAAGFGWEAARTAVRRP